MLPGETLQSMLPWDIPWWMSDHAVFFGVLYAVLLTLGVGLGLVVLKSLRETLSGNEEQAHGEH